MSIAQLIAIARAYWRLIAVIFLAVTCMSAGVLKLLPKTYTATNTLIVDPSNKDPLAGEQFHTEVLNNYVATQTELIQSPSVLLSVVDRLHLTADPAFASGYRGTGVEGLRDFAARNLSYAIQVDQGRGGQLMYINVSAKNADKAALLANTVSQVYLEQQRRRLNEPTGERAQRYSEQLAELRAKVAAAQDSVAAFRQRYGITDVTSATDSHTVDTESQALASLEARLLDAQNQRRTREANLTGGPVTGDDLQASPQIQRLRDQLHALEVQLAQLSATYGPQHPKVVEVKAQMAAVQASLNSETRSLGDNALTPLARAKALEEQYTKAVEEQRKKVLSLRAVQGEGGKLLLELDSAQAVYKRALDGYDQIVFASASNYSNVSVVSPATPPTNATKPNKKKGLLAGMMAGLGLGIVIPFAYELFINRRVRCRDDIERGFGIPVLAQFDAIPAAASTA
jgi:polysaccharide biosynthesis transport protein